MTLSVAEFLAYLLGAGGVATAALPPLIRWLTGRKESKADVAATLTGASAELIQQYQETNARLIKENREFRQDLATVKAEMSKTSASLHATQAELDAVHREVRELRPLRDVVEAEKAYVRKHNLTDAPVWALLHHQGGTSLV